MALRRLAETDLARRRPERALDGRVIDYRSQLLRHLRSQSLGRHAELFAEPVQVEDRVFWQADLLGEPISFTSLPEADQARVQANVGTLLAEVRREADRLRSEGSDAQRRLAEVLDRATRGIEWTDVWVVTEPEEHYVLAGWGLGAGEGRPPVADLLGESIAPLPRAAAGTETAAPMPLP